MFWPLNVMCLQSAVPLYLFRPLQPLALKDLPGDVPGLGFRVEIGIELINPTDFGNRFPDFCSSATSKLTFVVQSGIS